MTTDNSEWKDTLVHLFALASRLEGEGQYNLAKLARAACRFYEPSSGLSNRYAKRQGETSRRHQTNR